MLSCYYALFIRMTRECYGKIKHSKLKSLKQTWALKWKWRKMGNQDIREEIRI